MTVPFDAQPARFSRSPTITYFSSAEWLRKRGLLPDNGSLPEPRPIYPRNVPVAEIQSKVARYFGIPVSEMTSKRRSRTVARPRQVAMFICRVLTQRSLPEIGHLFGDRDHTTVIHAIRQIRKLANEDRGFHDHIVECGKELVA